MSNLGSGYKPTDTLRGCHPVIDAQSVMTPSGFGEPEMEIDAVAKPREYLPGTEPKVYGADAIPGKALR